MTATFVKKELQKFADAEKVAHLQRFFKTGPGEYAEGDTLIGVTVPNQRKVAKMFFKEMRLDEVERLLQSPVHEHRLTALFLLVYRFEKAGEGEREAIFSLYLSHTNFVNNWDLVDCSAPNIVGGFLMDRDRAVLYKLAKSKDLWERRIAMLATYAFIKKGDFGDAIAIAEILVDDSHDLIHKAVGWMLREIGNRNLEAEEGFLDRFYETMPRTMLRYAVERFDKKRKDFYMGR